MFLGCLQTNWQELELQYSLVVQHCLKLDAIALGQ
jgi:hypothetical protein